LPRKNTSTNVRIYTKKTAAGKMGMKDSLSKNTKEGHRRFSNRPNFLLIMVDEERYPPVYESHEIRKWRKENLLAQEFLRDNGMEFHRHYAGSTACSPSRGTLFTGQYPSLHGVTQTSGIVKDIFWLDFSSVPTMGDYFRAAGYRTFYKGKWHVSDEDILIPGTHNAFPSYNTLTGVPDKEKEDIYLNADRLDDFGFSGWIGPEPHGADPRNSGSSAAVGLAGRDQVYASDVVKLIESLDQEKRENPKAESEPWLIVSSFVNPHDITLFGEITRRNSSFNFEVDPTVPNVPPPPTLSESLNTKPRCQRSYRDVYPLFIQPTGNTNFYRRLYYQLQKNVDEQMLKVLQSLRDSSFYEDTIVIFTADHGELLGAHGGMH
jgi:arylsulfatase A-like enzyme